MKIEAAIYQIIRRHIGNGGAVHIYRRSNSGCHKIHTKSGVFNFCFVKGPQPLLWCGLRTAHVKITISGKPNRLKYFDFFSIFIEFRNVATGRLTQSGGTRVGDTLAVTEENH